MLNLSLICSFALKIKIRPLCKYVLLYAYLHFYRDLLLYLDLLQHAGAAHVEDTARIDPDLDLNLLVATIRSRFHLACKKLVELKRSADCLTALGAGRIYSGSGFQFLKYSGFRNKFRIQPNFSVQFCLNLGKQVEINDVW